MAINTTGGEPVQQRIQHPKSSKSNGSEVDKPPATLVALEFKRHCHLRGDSQEACYY